MASLLATAFSFAGSRLAASPAFPRSNSEPCFECLSAPNTEPPCATSERLPSRSPSSHLPRPMVERSKSPSPSIRPSRRGPMTGRLFVIFGTHRRSRAALSSRQLRRQRAVLRHGRRGMEARHRDDRRREGARLSRSTTSRTCPRATTTCRRCSTSTPSSPRRRSHHLGARRPVGRTALGHVAGQPRERSRQGALRPAAHTDGEARADEEAAGGRAARGHALGEAREDEERAALEVLGRAGVHRRDGAAAEGLRRIIDTTRYPAVYGQGHFGLGAPFGFVDPAETDARVAAAEADAAAAPSRVCGIRRRRSARESGLEFGKAWTSDDFPRFVAITWQHPTPYYDDSYAVNSVNNGPYQDALLTELVPELERRFHLHSGSERALPHRRIDRRLGVRRAPDSAPRLLRRRVVSLSRSGRLPPQSDGRHLRRLERVLPQQRAGAGAGALDEPHAGRTGSALVPADEQTRSGARQQRAQRPAVRRVGRRVRTGRRRRIPEASLGPRDRGDRQGRRRVLARQRLRPHVEPASELVEHRPAAHRQDARVRRRHGQLLLESRRVPDGAGDRRSSPIRRRTSRSSTAGR